VSNTCGISLEYSPGLLLFAIPIYFVFFFFIRKRKLTFYYDIVFILFLFYLIEVFSFTFLPFPLNNREIENWRVIRKSWPVFNVIPFHEL
jgi:glycopeptide antibiotics resistance protein